MKGKTAGFWLVLLSYLEREYKELFLSQSMSGSWIIEAKLNCNEWLFFGV